MKSIYEYDDCNILKNKLNIKNKKKLEEIERDIVSYRLYDLRKRNIIGNFTPNHLKEIHKYLFSDIYDFAGEYRVEDISKNFFKFANFKYIEQELIKILDKLKIELSNLKETEISKKDVAKLLAYYYSEINVIHPFREGNGRVLREFIRQIAYFLGYYINFTEVKAKDFLDASKLSVLDSNKLEQIYLQSLIKR